MDLLWHARNGTGVGRERETPCLFTWSSQTSGEAHTPRGLQTQMPVLVDR